MVGGGLIGIELQGLPAIGLSRLHLAFPGAGPAAISISDG